MDYLNKRWPVVISFVVLILLFMVGDLACEGPIPVRVINQTDQLLDVSINGRRIGEVNPGEEIKNKIVSASYKEYIIEAKNAEGDSVYSGNFTFDQLSRNMKWIVLITPPR